MTDKSQTPPRRFTPEELTAMADAMEARRVKVGDRLLTEVQAVRQAAADARQLEQITRTVRKPVEGYHHAGYWVADPAVDAQRRVAQIKWLLDDGEGR